MQAKNISKITLMLVFVTCFAVILASCSLVPGGDHECVDNDSNHICDECETAISTCTDEDGDHLCDICNDSVTFCQDRDNDHECDVCGEPVSNCPVDANNDHECDVCGDTYDECKDENNDHKCDKCNKPTSVCPADADPKDHKCDVCGLELGECYDDSDDHNCDWCGAVVSICADEDSNHMCDICQTTLSTCEDTNTEDNQCICDICKAGLCADDVDDDDHNCDKCNASMCHDDNGDCICEVCERSMHIDEEPKDHICDLCEVVLSKCEDTDGDKLCNVCGKDTALIYVYSDVPHATVNGKKLVKFYDGDVCTITPAFDDIKSDMLVTFWALYKDGTLINYIKWEESYTIEQGSGTYYVKPIFLAKDLKPVSPDQMQITISSTGKITNDCLTTDWFEVGFDQKPAQSFVDGMFFAKDDVQSYVVCDPTNAANLVLANFISHSSTTGGYGSNEITVKFDDSDKGNIVLEFDYLLDYAWCSGVTRAYIRVNDSKGNPYYLGTFSIPAKLMSTGSHNNTVYENAVEFGNFAAGATDSSKIGAAKAKASLRSDTWYTIRVEIVGTNVTTSCRARGSEGEPLFENTQVFPAFENAELTSFTYSTSIYGTRTIVLLDNMSFGYAHDCVTADADNNCDLCGMCICYDGDDVGHDCDACSIPVCYDGDVPDHICDECGYEFDHVDRNRDHNCDECYYEGLTTCADAAGDGDHLCDYGCGAQRSNCYDGDHNYICDECGTPSCHDDNEDHMCDIPGHESDRLSECVDNNKDHECDFLTCSRTVGTCADAAGDGDHLCDYGCGAVKGECSNAVVDGKDDCMCDECGKYLHNNSTSETVCSVCNTYLFGGSILSSGSNITIIHITGTASSSSEATTTGFIKDSITADARPEGRNYGVYYSLVDDPSGAANKVLSVHGKSANSGKFLTNYIKVAPTVINEGGALLVLQADVWVDAAGTSNAKNAIHLSAFTDAYDGKYGTAPSKGFQRVSFYEAADGTVDVAGAKLFKAKVHEWIRCIYVLDTVDNVYHVYFSVDGGKTYIAAKSDAAPSSAARIANFADVTYMGIESDLYNTSSQSYVDNLSVVRINSIVVPTANGNVELK